MRVFLGFFLLLLIFVIITLVRLMGSYLHEKDD